MDLNHLYAGHQIALIRAKAAVCPRARSDQALVADAFAARVNAHRHAVPAGCAAAL